MAVAVSRQDGSDDNRALLERLTARLPQWFGQASANRHYAQQAEELEGWAARLDRKPVGLLMLKRHGPASAEIYSLGVDPDHHRCGIGRTLIDALERQLRHERVKFLFVQTLHPDIDYEPYARTRAFYERLGFALALTTHQGPTGPSADPLAYYLKSL